MIDQFHFYCRCPRQPFNLIECVDSRFLILIAYIHYPVSTIQQPFVFQIQLAVDGAKASALQIFTLNVKAFIVLSISKLREAHVPPGISRVLDIPVFRSHRSIAANSISNFSYSSQIEISSFANKIRGALSVAFLLLTHFGTNVYGQLGKIALVHTELSSHYGLVVL